jgi:16S rRNA (guanine966-N2)-methyltransferase
MIPTVAKHKTELPEALPQPSSVRIIGGTWRGRRVSFPALPGLRPTPDRVRETLFNWLQHSIVDTVCLDLFAGSGALGLEALSRGAKEVVFVELAEPAARNLREQCRQLGTGTKANLQTMGAARFLASAPRAFDLIFLDPPFHQDMLKMLLPTLDAGPWVKDGTLVYLENERAAGAPALPDQWELLKSKSAGEVGYHLARVKGTKAK